MGKKFNLLEERYNKVRETYDEKISEINLELSDINEGILNDIKDINLLKQKGLDIHIQNYVIKMQFAGINYNVAILLKEEDMGNISISKYQYNEFKEYIGFNTKNKIQKIITENFSNKKLNIEVDAFEKQIDDIILQRKAILSNTLKIKDEVSRLMTAINILLNCIEKIEAEFDLYKQSFLKIKDVSGMFNKDALTGAPQKVFLAYENLITVLIDVIRTGYIKWDNKYEEKNNIIETIYSLKKEVDEVR